MNYKECDIIPVVKTKEKQKMTDTEKHIEENKKFWDDMPVKKRTELNALAMKCMASECHPPRLPKKKEEYER